MDEEKTARRIARHMLDNDAFSRWMGVEILETAPGRSVLRAQIRDEMTNGFAVTHGGLIYSLADSALAFAAGSRGRVAMTIESSISHIKAVYSGDVLTAEAEEVKLGRQTGVYNITVSNQNKKVVAVMRGTVYRTNREIEFDP